MPKWQTVARSIFLMIQKWKLQLNPVAACGITMAKHYGFEWFHFFHLVTDFVSAGMISGVIVTPFGDLGETFNDFGRVLEKGLKFDDF